MKLQDILFIFLVIFFIYKKNPKWVMITGLVCLLIAIPLFAKWIFFTAERLTWYAAGFFLLAICIQIFQLNSKKEKI
jgi:hypothetical protein